MTMTQSDLCLLPIKDLSTLIRTRALSPVEVVDSYLARIEAIDPRVESYLTVTDERARSDARRAETEISRGSWRGPLHGIPVALKDLFDTAGVPTTANSPLLRTRIPQQEATVSARLHAAGTVLLGKLKMYEFAMGVPYPGDQVSPARNPWDLDRIPGGSSSGSGAALAAGLCAGSFGSDTGGSIRHPAHMSGVVGLKPTYGLVSRNGVIPLSWTLDHVGPMARTVEDAALLLQAVAGHDPADPSSARGSVPNYVDSLSGSVRGVRIGVPEKFIESVPGLQPDILAAFRSALDVLRGLGAELHPVVLPAMEHIDAIFLPILLSEAVAYHSRWMATRHKEYGPGFWYRLLPGITFTGADYVQAQRGRAMLCHAFYELMATVDLIATPTVRETAPTLVEHMGIPHPPRGPFTGLFNLTGQPSISVPCGFDHRGLPIGLMLTGRAFDEVTVLRTAHAYEQATDWHLHWPELSGKGDTTSTL